MEGRIIDKDWIGWMLTDITKYLVGSTYSCPLCQVISHPIAYGYVYLSSPPHALSLSTSETQLYLPLPLIIITRHDIACERIPQSPFQTLIRCFP